MLRVKAGGVYHFGIYVSDSEVWQFGLSPLLRNIPDREIEVCASSLEAFSAGAPIEVAVFDEECRATEDVIEYARSKKGTRGYSILYNNCEHFAYECKTGKRYSQQTDGLRNFFRNMPITDVYLAKIPDAEISPVSSPQRQAYIEKANHPLLKKQRYYVWKLLEYALTRSFGIKERTFSQDEAGFWRTDECYFSLSHSENAVAVAVSRSRVGVDVEKYAPVKSEALVKRALTEEEYSQYLASSDKAEFFVKKWTQKESLFKMQNLSVFKPSEFTESPLTKTDVYSLSDGDYFFSVSSETIEKLRIFKDIKL